MIKTSTDFANSVKELSRTFRCRLKRTDSIINCTVQKLSVYKGIMGDKVVFGSVYIPYMEAELQEFSGSLMGSLLSAEVGLLTGKNEDGSEKFEYLKIGTFEVSEESYNDGILKIKAVGSLSTKFVGLYSSELSYPASVLQVAEELTSQTGVNISFDSYINTSATIENEPKGLQRSEMICYLAGLVGACATEDANGNVVIKRISSGESIEVTGERCIQVPSFSSSYDLTGLRVVAGNSYEEENGNPIPEKSFSYGGPIKMEYPNPFMKQSDFDLFAADVVGYSFNPATVPLALGDPRIEPWDYILFTDRKGEVYTVPCLNIEHTFDGGFSTKITAPGAESVSESSSAQSGPISKMVERTYTKMEAVEHMLAGKATINELNALKANISDLDAKTAEVETLKTQVAEIDKAYAGEISAINANINTLSSEKVDINMANIGQGWVNDLLVKGDFLADSANAATGNFSKYLTGVNIVGDNIQAGTISTDRLIIRDPDSNEGILYALNNGAVEQTGLTEEQAKRLTLDGKVIAAESITADKINVTDLFAQDITSTGNFNLGGSGALYYDAENDKLSIKASSIEIGTKQVATQKDVENLQIGDRNLILDSATERASSKYLINPSPNHYEPATPLIAGEEYTIVACVTPAEGVTHIIVTMSNGNKSQGNLYVSGTEKQIVSTTFTAKYIEGKTPDDAKHNSYLYLYRKPNDGTVTGETTIHWVKVVKGNKATTDWTPAPEDTEGYIANEITNAALQMSKASEKTMSNMLESYATSGDIEEYKKQIENKFKENKEGFAFEFNQIEEKITSVNNEIVERNQFIRLENGEIVIGKSDSPIISVYTNNALEFRYNGVTVARFTNEVLGIRNVNMENQFRLHDKWAFRKGEYKTGKGNNLDLVWLG